jgi:histidinol dehydrogenase
MQTYLYPTTDVWNNLLKRPTTNYDSIYSNVQSIMQAVQTFGDAKLFEYTQKFDGVVLNNLSVSEAEISEAISLVSDDLKNAITIAIKNITTFHQQQTTSTKIVETMSGVECWRKAVAIDKVGLYIPGGTAPLFSTLLMLAIPAKIAGCKEIVITTPPQKNGTIHPAILFAAQELGIKTIYKIGGVQAIAALTFGTESVQKVFKIFGPGNQYVTMAKQLAQQFGVAIDMPAGPSEVCIWATSDCEASFVAADLLSQAEHGIDSQVILVTSHHHIIDDIKAEINKQITLLPRKDIAQKALLNSKVFVLNNEEEIAHLINEYAPEHLIITGSMALELSEKITNAGSIFLGNYSPESVGDYASGTNHTLPTNGYAKMYSGVSVDSFVKKITYQKLTQQGLQNIGKAVVTLAEAEGLQAHANAVKVRWNEMI